MDSTNSGDHGFLGLPEEELEALFKAWAANTKASWDRVAEEFRKWLRIEIYLRIVEPEPLCNWVLLADGEVDKEHFLVHDNYKIIGCLVVTKSIETEIKSNE